MIGCDVMAFSRLTIGFPLISGRAGRAAVHVAERKVAVPVARRGAGDDRGTILEDEGKPYMQSVTQVHQCRSTFALTTGRLYTSLQ